jgi:tetratricopeptide (TPR) repeat protein
MVLEAEIATAKAISTMKKYYTLGVNAFLKQDYPTSVKWLNKAVKIPDRHVPAYYYAEAYATLGVIYHFHIKTKGHKAKALLYYKKALKYDPYNTKSAKKYIKLLQ